MFILSFLHLKIIYINNKFTQNKIYYHDGMKNGGKIMELKEGEDWKEIGIPYLVINKKIEVE